MMTIVSLFRVTSPAVLLLALGAACATLGSDRERGSHSSNEISFEEIRGNTAGTAYELVQSLRPRWLRMRGKQSIVIREDIAVYMDHSRLGGRAALRSVSVNAITSARFLDSGSATQRWGTGHAHGAILLSTAPPRD